ncbi:MAG TPA: hypothetical protein VF981_11470 [Gemmatimonadaceae bacterium]
MAQPIEDPTDDLLACAERVARLRPHEGASGAWDVVLGHGHLQMRLREGQRLAAMPDEQLLQCGAALENLRLALRYFGYAETARIAPDGDDAPTVARIDLTGARSTSPEDEFLYQALLPDAHTAGSQDGGLSPALIGLLRHAARCEGAWLEPVGGDLRFQRSPLHAVIGTPGAASADWIRAGEALQRVRLHASLQGFRVSVVSTSPPPTASRTGPASIPATRGEPKVVARFDVSPKTVPGWRHTRAACAR